MGFRPICDFWLMARPKVKYYGAFPSGFLWRAKTLLGDTSNLCHLCSGMVEGEGFKIDLDPAVSPDLVADATDTGIEDDRFSAVLCDAPYTQEDAENYRFPDLPTPNMLLKEALRIVKVGGRVGFLHYICPRPPKNAKFVACIALLVGFNNRVRLYSVFEKTSKAGNTK